MARSLDLACTWTLDGNQSVHFCNGSQRSKADFEVFEDSVHSF